MSTVAEEPATNVAAEEANDEVALILDDREVARFAVREILP